MNAIQRSTNSESPATRERGLAIFDLDGTLLSTDSFLPFLISFAWRQRRFWPLMVLPVYVGLYVCRLMRDRTAKERLVRAFCGGQSCQRIDAHADWFCQSWVARRLRPEVVARLRGHLESGHRVILLSASPDLYVPAIGRSLGIDEVICTRVEKEDGVCRGQLDGANCKGDEKVAAVIRYLGQADSPAMSYAYGDSRHDLPILRWVRHGFLVKKGQLTRVEH